MANVTWNEILDAIAELMAGAHDELTDRVFTRQRFIEAADDVDELVRLLQSLNSDGKPQGIVLDWLGSSSIRGAGFSIIQTEQFQGAFLLPYDDKRSDDQTSTQVFRDVTAALRTTFNARANHELGLGSSVQSLFLQLPETSSGPIRNNSGEDAVQVHARPLRIAVQVIIDSCLEAEIIE